MTTAQFDLERRLSAGRGRRPVLGCICGIVGVALVACSSSGTSASGVDAAQAKVSAKQKAVTDAQSDLATKVDAFCKSANTYITGLDRYGDVLNQGAPTVGDVKVAGQDLAKPREASLSGAQAAVDANEKLVTAQNELVDAKAALASAQATASGRPAPTNPSTGTATPKPLAPSATVNRVKQAEDDFAKAQKGITDETKLTEAGQEFNAAAVALEMSWLKLFADGGCLTDQQQKEAQAAVQDYTSKLQTSLSDAGYYDGKVDGVYGPATVDAVKALQKKHDLPVTGTVDKATDAALEADLQAKGGAASKNKVASTAAVQQTLKLAGFWDGPVDGDWTPALTDALKKFQEELGVKPTGTVDAATIAALEKSIANVGKAKADASSSAAPSSTPPRSRTTSANVPSPPASS